MMRKWYEVQFVVTAALCFLFIMWTLIFNYVFNVGFVEQDRIFALMIGLLVTSGIIMIIGTVYGQKLESDVRKKRKEN